ncbi:MAG: NAD(P)/FAD-dependent oxidoreductase [Syntrophomonadaceae bacterium]|nr:NAD(P)/FAD-dependent oxidoreductase [Syntrophomonadaceae bacterium]MDD3023211.1 NAD(P)/FAD-dependent oxidoreductase [Syntrophomonadaceae bacterium]
MKLRVREIKLPLEHDKDQLRDAVARRLGISNNEISELKLVKKAVDARRKTISFSYTVDVDLDNDIKLSPKAMKSVSIVDAATQNASTMPAGSKKLTHSPLVVGAGPAGLFCALYLARNGYKPVVFERGQDMDRRVTSVNKFWRQGVLNPASNAQFGEGGAGAFSDGKLTARSADERIPYIMKTFVKYGANEEILYVKKPHLGTDVIRDIIKKIRQEILSLGGEFYFDACMTDININQSRLRSIIINNETEVPCSLLVLAVGNSARDVYRLLYNNNINMQSKAFAVGVRIEHKQELIDRIQYGSFAGHPQLGAADYHLTYQDTVSGRSFYTFCMCPGGYVIAAASGTGQVVTNGMSYLARNTGIANCALVATVNPSDWDNRVLGGVEFQEKLEKRAFNLGGGQFRAPAQYLKDFLAAKKSVNMEKSLATYRPGVTAANLWELFPQGICETMSRGIKHWDQKLQGFINETAVLTGAETRTSAPLRIERNEEMTSTSIANLYPCGEGAGYAGGIISSALDGLKIAENIIATYRKPEKDINIASDNILNARELLNK